MKSKRMNHLNIKRKCLALAIASCFVSHVNANPSGASVVRGSATLSTNGNTLTVDNSPGAIINWHDFSINAGETTIFNQINAASAVLNRVTGGNISQIFGTLQSNGRVFLINPSGIVFGANAVVDVAGLVASTLNLTDADFIAGKKLFNADTANAGSVINHGEIKTPAGGFVYLLAPKVENNGIITTPSGEAILAAGNSVEIVDSVNPMQRVVVSAQSQDVNLSALMTQSNGNIFSVLNRGTVSANTVQQDATGRIFFKSAGSIQTTASSVIEAKGDTLNNGGKFIGFADTAGVYAGRFDASGKNGGFIETSGHYLDVTGIDISARALAAGGKAGDWLLDPYNITIATGDNNISAGPIFTPTGAGSTINAATILAALDSGTNVTVDTVGVGAEAGNINITASLVMTGSSDASLTFNADGAITMADGTVITDTGAGNLSVTMLADRNAVGPAGGITATVIDVGGDVSLTSNTGNFSFGGATASQVVRGANVTLDIDGNVNLAGGTLFNESVLIEATSGNVSITAGGALNLTGGTHVASNTSAGIVSSGNITINTGADINLQGGTGSNSEAYITGDGDVNIRTGFSTGGNVVLTGGSGAFSNAVIESIGGDVGIEFRSSGLSLNLTGGSGATDSEAVIAAIAGDVQIRGDINAHNSQLNITGGSDADADAGIVGNSISGLRVTSINMLAGSAGDAFIATTNTTGVSPININVTNGTTAGSVTLTGAAGTKAEIGSQAGNVNIQITAGSLELLGTAVTSVAGIGASGSGNNAIVNINATDNGVMVIGAGARIGSTGGNALIGITGASSDIDQPNGIVISGGASVGSLLGTSNIVLDGTTSAANGAGVTVDTGSVVGTTSGNILITGTASPSSGSRGVSINSGTVSASTSGNVTINGTGGGAGNADGVFTNGTASVVSGSGNINITGIGSASGTSAAGVALADSSNISAGGNIAIDGTGQSGSGNSFGVVMFGSSTSPTISSSSGNVNISASSVVTGAVSLQAPSITAANGSVSIAALNNNNIALGDAQITAGTAVNLNAVAGKITQTSEGRIVAPRLNARALNINLGSLFNNFNSAMFATNNLFTLGNSASGTIDYEFSQAATVYDISQDNATTLNITALSGLTIDGSMNSLSGSGTPIDNVNVTASDLKLTNAADISVGNNLRVVAQSLTMDSNSSVSVGNNANIAAESIVMDNASISAGNDVNVLTKNLNMTASSILADNNVNVNSVPLAFKLAAGSSNLAQIQNIFNQLTQGVQIGLREGSIIFASNNTNVAGAAVKLEGSEIGSGNVTSVFSRNNIELTGGTDEARIFAQNEVLLVAGKQVILNDGDSGAIVETDSPNTIFLSFPKLASDGYVVNGVVNAINNGRSGFFAGGLPAVLDTNLFVTYEGVNGLLRAFFNQNISLQTLTTDASISPDVKNDNKKDNDQMECS